MLKQWSEAALECGLRHRARLIFLLNRMRSFRALSDAVSEARLRAVLERQLEALRP